MSRRVAVVGIGQTYHQSKRPDADENEMISEAVRSALSDAQLTMKDIDAIASGNIPLFEGQYYGDGMTIDGCGAYMKPQVRMNTGGTVGATTVDSGITHVASGVYDVVLVVGYQKHDIVPATSMLNAVLDRTTQRPFGSGAIGAFGLLATKYMAESGCEEIHAAIARSISGKGASRNPFAHLRTSYTVEQVMESPMLASPVRLLHMCPQSCGACAMIFASEEKAERIHKKPVWIRDYINVHQECWAAPFGGEPYPPPPSYEIAASKLYKRNGITNPRKDIQVVEMYDPSSWILFLLMESCQFSEKNQAWRLVEQGITDMEGELPINPSGGVVCTNPPSASAMIRVAEAALQLRGEAGEHQVTREVKQALAIAFGGCNYSVMHLLAKDK